MIAEAENVLLGASHMGRIGRYQLEAAVQSAHAIRRFASAPDWAVLESLYDALLAITKSPVVAINRALVIAETRSPKEALALLRGVQDQRLSAYQPYWAALAELLARCGSTAAADEAYDTAMRLESDPIIRAFLQMRRQGSLEANRLGGHWACGRFARIKWGGAPHSSFHAAKEGVPSGLK